MAPRPNSFFFNFKNDDFFRKIRRIANERAEAEIDRIKEEESTKRKILMKKHAVWIFFYFLRQLYGQLRYLDEKKTSNESFSWLKTHL